MTSVLQPRRASTCLRAYDQPSAQMLPTVNPSLHKDVLSLDVAVLHLGGDVDARPEQEQGGDRMFGSHRWPWLHGLIRTILAAAAFTAMVVLVLGGPAKARGIGPALGIRWIAFLVAVGASLILLRMGRLPKRAPASEPIGLGASTSPTPQQLLNARVQASVRYSSHVLDLFSRMLQKPSKYTTRVIENVEIREGCLCLQTVMEFALLDGPLEKIRESSEPVVILPLIKLAKGATLDNLEILDAEERHVSPLLQEELYGLLATVIKNLFRSAYMNGKDEGERSLTVIEESVLSSLTQIVCNPERVDKTAISSILGLLDTSQQLKAADVNTGRESVDGDAASYLRNLCEFFAENYLLAIEVEVPRGHRLSIKYSRTIPLYEQTATLDNRSRVRLGLSSRSFTVPLTLPFEAPSYHFSMAGVPGGFVASQKLFEPPNNVISPGTFQNGNGQPFFSTKCESALPYTHLHTRGLQRFRPIEMWTRVEFEEVPPGALGGALVVSTASAILIWFFTLTQPGLRAPLSQASDLPALLLTVPAFVATWIGNSVDRVQRSSISTYIGLGVSTAVSLGSALLYIANANHKAFFTIGSFTFYHGLIRLKDVDATWLLLALIASVVSGYLAESLREKLHWYMRLLANDSGFRGDH
jgi:hypothetical protein